MANALADLIAQDYQRRLAQGRNLGFTGDQGTTFNAASDQSFSGQNSPITNATFGLPAQGVTQPQMQGSTVDVMGQGKGYMQPDGTITGVNAQGQRFTVNPAGTEAMRQAQIDQGLKRQMMQAQIADTQSQAATRQAQLSGQGMNKPTFSAEAGGYIYPPTPDNPQGKFVPVQGLPQNMKPLTEYQGQSVMYGTRAADAHDLLNSLEGKISTAGLKSAQAVENIPLVGTVARTMLSPEQQQVDQAQRNFVNAVMRRESGATISPTEFDNAKRQYFPQAGDSPEVVAQKRRNRDLVINAFSRGAGSGAKDIQDVLANSPYRNMQSEQTTNLPARNAQGWTLHVDANGNKAYVSPDGSQYKEVK